MLDLKYKKWVVFFGAVVILVLAQLGWWMTILLRDISLVSSLKTEYLSLRVEKTVPKYSKELEIIKDDAFHRRLMIWSESGFFILLTCFGFYLLYKALKTESRSREIEKNFIDVVSHESKTPLTAMKLRLESLVEKCGEQSIKNELGLALEEVRRLSSIYDKAMGWNRIERQTISLELISVSELLREVVKRLDPLFKAKSVQCSAEVDDETLIMADPFILQNALQNVFENAVIYNPRQDKKISVWAAKKGSEVTLSISDNGPGISTEDSPHVFERFYRGKYQNSMVPGTGLGLYIVSRVVEAHQGTIELKQSDMGGAEFTMLFPSAAV